MSDELAGYRQQAREAKGRAEEATPGPWLPEPGSFEDIAAWPSGGRWPTEADWEADEVASMDVLRARRKICTMGEWPPESWRADATFIAAARSDVPTLADAVLALADTVERLQAEDVSRRPWSDDGCVHEDQYLDTLRKRTQVAKPPPDYPMSEAMWE